MAILLGFSAFVVSGCMSKDRPIDVNLAEELVSLVDTIPVPVPYKDVSTESDESVGEYTMKFKIDPKKFPILKAEKEVWMSLSGSRENPNAVIFVMNGVIGRFYVPFKGVREVDRTRRLSKIADRVYLIESNRTAKGILVTKDLP